MEVKNKTVIHAYTHPFINISLYLKGIKPIQSLTIKNIDEEDSKDIEIRISCDVNCMEPFQYSIPFIPAQTDVSIPLTQLKVNRSFFNEITETEVAHIKIEVLEKEQAPLTEEFPIHIHPIEYFGGFEVLPELIASYVTPNHPYIYHLKRKAADILQNAGLKTTFEGYQSNDPERVLQLMSSIYAAIQSEEIIYSSLPPGYEERGQRLRLLNTIQQEGFGNCIDISLLFCACLEAIDLNPVLIVVRGHAFVGCWLQDDKFSEVINDDKTAITKRISKGIREIATVEATSVCKGKNMAFGDALNLSEMQLIEQESFLFSIDIKRARTLQIRPLPLLSTVAGTQLDLDALNKLDLTEMQNQFDIGTIYQDELLTTEQTKTKQKIWERKLLDLSLRNNLLNLRMTRNMLQFVDIDIHHLEDTLSDGKSFSIMPNPSAEILRKYNLFSQPLHHSSPLYQAANDEVKYNRLLTHYHQQDLDNILVYMHKNAKLSIEENGSSTLYLAVGLLQWYDRKTPEQPRYAPILLLPVELSRRSVNSKFTLKSREEEPMINITLIEFLRQEYELNLSGLEQLPYDDKGVDVAKVMGILRRAIIQLKGWDIKEQLVLGNFSFSKLILWKDIVMHQKELLENNMVRSLIEGKLSFNDVSAPLSFHEFDTIPSQSLILPIPTDVSQMEAVLTAQQGSSFILHGPPGTGKSQTITNIIADALYHGKKVLFVAAKKAALDVVHRRLEHIGLDPFSLELHSNKSKKSDVLEQLAKSLDTAKYASSINFEQEAIRLDTAKKEISDYINILHQKQPFGWSLYDSITALENYKHQDIASYAINSSILQELDESLWQKWVDWVPQFQTIIRLLVHPSENPLAELNINQYHLGINEAITDQTSALIQLLREVESQAMLLSKDLNFSYSLESKSHWQKFVAFVEELENIPDLALELAYYLADAENFKVYEEWAALYKAYQDIHNTILSNYNRSIFTTDLSTLQLQWKEAQLSWFLPKWLKSRKIKKQLSLYRNTPFANDGEINELFAQHERLQELTQQLRQNRFVETQKALKNLFKDEMTDLNDIQQKAEKLQKLSNIASTWDRNAFQKWVGQLLNDQLQYIDEIKRPHQIALNKFAAQVGELTQKMNAYEELTGFQFEASENWIPATQRKLQGILEHVIHLKNWMNYIHLKKQGESLKLNWLIDSFEGNVCSVQDFTSYFYFNVYQSTAIDLISQHESLNLFNVDLFENKINQYKKIANDFKQLTIQELRLRLATKLPNTSVEAMQSSEIGILQRAIKNRGRGMSIRRLFDQIPSLLPRLAPCMLMSPISVAQYFDVNTDHFDLVIFDEASQLPTCEAVSALARAKQAVIVGDPKQMPPTSFFNTIKLDEENMEIEDLESILDDCLALSVPSKYLLRHYRSKHESLISFSNVNYYDNKLLTFPSADDLNRKVKYHHVVGHYDKGKTRTNSFEADAIVNYVMQHYSDPKKRKLSLGVVTFSQTQQNLIEEKLQKLYMTNPALETTVSESEEPLFIKNLENVQGDERDIILFSICYAPDEDGKMSMNFGPLNRNGGWRRLNVAVTRARYEMHIFATLRADQIDLGRTSAEGVAGLKSFLQFAEKGYLALRPQDIANNLNSYQLSKAISKKLEEKGLQVKTNIGTSGFKVDIGIVHPQNENQYILGILIDGEYYYNAQTTNDREMVMPAVLGGLGWKLHRIWSMDWYENSSLIINAIVAKVQQLLEEKVNITEEPEEVIPHAETALAPLQSMEPALVHAALDNKVRPYVASRLPKVSNSSSEQLYEFQNRNKIKEQIRAIVETEAPISKNLLFKKLLQAWNTSRAGAKLDMYLQEVMQEMNLLQTQHQQPFYWHDNIEIDYYRSNDIEKRNIEDIAPEEILVALEEAVRHNLSIEEGELLRYLARVFGFAKVGRQIENVLSTVVALAVSKQIIKRENGRIKLF